MACSNCGAESQWNKYCYDCAYKNEKCAECGGGPQFAHFVVCENCLAKSYGKCKCGKPNDVDGTCILACSLSCSL